MICMIAVDSSISDQREVEVTPLVVAGWAEGKIPSSLRGRYVVGDFLHVYVFTKSMHTMFVDIDDASCDNCAGDDAFHY